MLLFLKIILEIALILFTWFKHLPVLVVLEVGNLNLIEAHVDTLNLVTPALLRPVKNLTVFFVQLQDTNMLLLY